MKNAGRDHQVSPGCERLHRPELSNPEAVSGHSTWLLTLRFSRYKMCPVCQIFKEKKIKRSLNYFMDIFYINILFVLHLVSFHVAVTPILIC